MTHPLQPAYDLYEEKLKKMLPEVRQTKNMLNELAKEMGLNPPYPDETEFV